MNFKYTIDFTPKEIVAELDKYIIGQNEAKKTVAIALRNRWRRLNTEESIQKEISPNNILMIGSTGIGKTEIARRIAKISSAPFIKVEASKFTEVGYVGRDVESMVRDLVEQSVNMVKAIKKEELQDRAMQNVEEIILDALIPPVSNGSMKIEGDKDSEQNEQTRAWFKEKIKNKEIEDKKIEINVKQAATPNVGMISPMGMDDASMMGIQEMISGMMPKKNRKRKVSIEEARKLLLEDEVAKLMDMDEVKEEAISRAENMGIIFIDEIDKIARANKGGQSGGDISREGVQRDLLPIVEGSAVNTKYGIVNTTHILFVAAGAFHFSKPSDLIPELQGRFPIRVELNKLTREDFVRILKEPQNSLIRQNKALFNAEGVEVSFTDDAIDEIADIAYNVNEEIENIGARRLQTVITQVLNEYLFAMPDDIKAGEKIEITKELVQDKLRGLVNNKDLSHYIL